MPKTCNAKLVLGDDFGDNDCTFKCSLSRKHLGPHMERGLNNSRAYKIEWTDLRSDRQKFFDWYDDSLELMRIFWHDYPLTYFWIVRSKVRRLLGKKIEFEDG